MLGSMQVDSLLGAKSSPYITQSEYISPMLALQIGASREFELLGMSEEAPSPAVLERLKACCNLIDALGPKVCKFFALLLRPFQLENDLTDKAYLHLCV